MVKPPFGLSLEECLGILHVSLTEWTFKTGLSKEELERLQKASVQLGEGWPLAYVSGKVRFMGMDLDVDPRVLIPRPETEEWVVFWLEHLAPRGAGVVLEVGTGSGAIALAVKKHRPDLRVLASDLSEDALAMASHNAKRLGLEIEFFCGDGLNPFADQFVDWVLSNPPYIGQEERQGLEDSLKFEPELALFAEEEGLVLHKQFLERAIQFLKPGGGMMLELGPGQGSRLKEMFSKSPIEIFYDNAGRERAVRTISPWL